MPAPPGLDSLRPLLRPRSFAIIGASSDPRKAGGRPLHYAKTSGFKGEVYPINPRGGEVQGVPAYPSVSAVDGPIDCALIAIPGAAVERAIEECAAKGVRSAVILSAGFAETGAAGKRSQDRLTAIARSSGMRIVGPNCMGLFNVATNFYCTFTAAFADPVHGWPRPGRIGIVSQSGGVGIHVYTLARDRGLGFSKWITTGNECDIGYGECVAALAEDDATSVILVYAEGCRDPAMLVEALEAARARHKPVIVLKVGRSDIGAEAAISHTASLAGSDKAFDALLRQHGAYRVRTVEELIDIAAACDHGRFPATREIGLVSISGGIARAQRARWTRRRG